MENATQWALLRAGKVQREAGLRLIQQAYARQPGPSQGMELGVALLWLGEFKSAYEHFRSRIDVDPNSGDNDYGMAGGAKWCDGKPNEAASTWRAGLGAKYARASGLNVRMPLLLFFASVMKPGIVDRGFAKALILERTLDPRIENWPGPIAKWISGGMTDADFQNQCRTSSPQETRDRQWLARFYRSLVNLEKKSESLFKSSMRELTDTNQPEWQDEDVLLTRIWNEEFFLARHEADNPAAS